MSVPIRWSFATLAFFAAAGALLFTVLLRDVSPLASLDLRYTRAEIMQRSTDYLNSLGYDVHAYQQDAWLNLDQASQAYLQTVGGMRGANDMIRADSLSTHFWSVTWYDRALSRSQSRESFSVSMSPGGRVIGFDHVIPDSIVRRSLSAEEARSRAAAFLRSQGFPLERYVLRTSSEGRLVGRLDHRFVWALPDTTVDARLWVRVQGDEIGGFRQDYQPGGAFRSGYADVNTTMTFLITGSFAVMFLLFFSVVILFLKKYHEGEVGTRTASLVLVGLFAAVVLSTVNEYHTLGADTQLGDLNKFNVRIVMFVMSVFILQLFLVVLVFAAWSVGESSARSVWPSKLTGADSALARRYLTVDLGRGLVRGYCWGFILLGVSAVFLFLFLGRDGLHAIARSAHGVPEGLVPFLSPVTNAVFDAAFGEIIFRLFFLSFLKEKTGRTWIGVAVSTVLWTLTGLSMWQLPFGSLLPVATVLMLAAFGLAFSFLFLRYDLVTSITANFVVLALPNAIPLLTSSGPAFAAAEWGFFALMGLPLVLGVVAVVRGVPFEFTPDTLPAHVKRISERVRMAKELEIARTVQMSLLPKENPHQEGLDIAGICLPAQEVGGDYYDFIGMGGRRIGIALGDVSGKGVPAAIYMTLTKGILQSHAEDNVSPKTVLSKVNALMYRTIERNSFVSMLYAVLDLDSRTIRFARAGQCPVILTQPASMPAEFLSPRGMALGLEMGKVFDAVLEEEEMPLRSGETLVFYTDGFTEAMTEHEEEFGEARLVESVRRHRHLPAPDVIRAVVDDVRTFTSGHPQHDDMTMVVVKVA